MSQFDSKTTGSDVVKAFATEARGKIVLITGPSANTIGGETAINFAAGKPELLLLAGRNVTKIQPVIDHIEKSHPDVRVKFVKLDLADLASVRKAAKEINSLTDKLDVLINNAGVMAVKTYATSVDGIELQLAANHVGHFLLTNLLMDKILAAGNGARIVNVSSFGYLAGGVRYDDWNFRDGKEYNPWTAYSQSKTANILFASCLADKLKKKGVQAFSVNPGLILETNLQDDVTPEMFQEGYKITLESLASTGEEMPNMAVEPVPLAAGTSTTLFAALDPTLASHSGAFLTGCAVWTEPLRAHARGEKNQAALWKLSEKLVGQELSW